jgi:hypothetical protein
MPRVTIKKEDLPPVSAEDGGYNIRLRLISQDRNRTSFWTPLYTIDAPDSSVVNYSVVANTATTPKTVTLIWDGDAGYKEYDVFVSWLHASALDDAGWEYKGTISTTTYALIVPTTPSAPTSFKVAVQRATYPKEVYPAYTIFDETVVHAL